MFAGGSGFNVDSASGVNGTAVTLAVSFYYFYFVFRLCLRPTSSLLLGE